MADIWFPVALRKLFERTEIGVIATRDLPASEPSLIRYRLRASAHKPRTTSFRVTSPREAFTVFRRDNSTLAAMICRFAVICRLNGLWGAENSGSGSGSFRNCF